MNAYEVKAGMVCLQCKTVWSPPERFRGEFPTMGHCTNLSAFAFAPLLLVFCLTDVIFMLGQVLGIRFSPENLNEKLYDSL